MVVNSKRLRPTNSFFLPKFLFGPVETPGIITTKA